MVNLRWLQLRGFRSFAEENLVKFPDHGLVLIRGSNPETGDASGSGKSSLLLAIAYVLDTLPKGFPATELQSWQSQSMQVDLGLEVDGKEVVLGRGKKTYVKWADRKEAITGAKAVAEEQQRILGLSPEIFGAMTYRAQNTPGLFISKTDLEKKEFLTRILGLDNIEEAVDISEKKIKDLAPRLEAALLQHQQCQAALESVQAAHPHPGVAGVDTTGLEEALRTQGLELKQRETEVQEVQRELNQVEGEAQQHRDEAAQVLKNKVSQAREFLQKARDVETTRQGEFRKKQENLQQQIRQYDATLQHIGYLKEERRKVLEQLAAAKEGKCPTCFRQWDESKKKEEELQQRVTAIEANAGAEDSLKASRLSAQNQLQELVFAPDPNIEKLVSINTKLSSELRAIQEQRVDTSHLTQKMAVANQAVFEIRMAMKENQSQLALAISQRDAQVRELNQYQLRLADAERRASEVKTVIDFNASELGAERDFVGVMGREGFLGVIFEEVLREISDEANTRLGRLANVSHVSIGFRTEVMTQTKGTVRRNITTIVNIAGRETRMETGLSGGMQTSVEQVVDLAVMTVVQRRTGRIPGWLCLDEAFNGQGLVTHEAALEVLREFASDKLVLVVDHGTEFKEMFTSFIDVEQTQGLSRVVA